MHAASDDPFQSIDRGLRGFCGWFYLLHPRYPQSRCLGPFLWSWLRRARKSAASFFPRVILIGGLGLACARAAEPAFPFAEATIDDLQARMTAGKLTAHELT